MSESRVGSIARLSWRLWRRGAAEAVGTSPRVLDAALVVLAVLAVALSTGAAITIASLFQSLGDLPADADRSPYLRLVFAGTVAGAALCQLLVSATASEQSSLRDVLAVLPVGRIERSAGIALPSSAVALGTTIVLAAPSSVVLGAVLGDRPLALIGAIGLQVLLLALVSVLVPGTLSLLRRFCRVRLHLPLGYATTVGSAVVVVGASALVVPELLAGAAGTGGAPSPVDPIAASVTVIDSGLLGAADASSGALLAAGVLLLWCVAAAGVALAAALLSSPIELSTSVRLMVGARVPRRRGVALVWMQLLQIVRIPQFIVLSTLPVLLAIALVVARAMPALAAIVDTLSAIPIVAPFAVGMYAYGLTRESGWVLRLGGVTRWRDALTRLVATGVAGAAPAVMGAVVLVVGGPLAPAEAALRLELGLVLWAAAVTAGALVPFSPAQQLSSTITGVVTFVVFALATIPIQLVLDPYGEAAVQLGTAGGFAVVLGAYLTVAALGSEPVPRRA